MIETRNLVKKYKDGDLETTVLKGINFKAATGEFLAIMGRSGAGKSTFLYQMSLLDHPSEGAVFIDGVNTSKLSTLERTSFRLMKLGYVFQDYALMPELTAVENVMVPLLMQGMSFSAAQKKAGEALLKVGLGHRVRNLPSQLSGGEQQRVSIARAISHDPQIIFADEPTANLDSESSAMVLNILLELHKGGQTIIMVTHELEYGKMAQRIVTLEDGKITNEGK